VHWSRPLLLPLAAALLHSSDLEAQSAQPISLQVSGIYNGVFGDVFDGLNNGIGGEAQLRYTPGALSLGAGFQYTVHELDQHTEDARLYGGFFEPRYRIRTGSNVVAPYISARFAVMKMGFSGGDLSVNSTFIQLNGGGGLLYRIGPRLNLDLGATYGYDRLGSGIFKSEERGPIKAFPATSGTNLVLRLGLAVGLGG
jgi:Outer membrane protein beta-barrel domain